MLLYMRYTIFKIFKLTLFSKSVLAIEKIARDLSIIEPAVLLLDNEQNLVNRQNSPKKYTNQEDYSL